VVNGNAPAITHVPDLAYSPAADVPSRGFMQLGTHAFADQGVAASIQVGKLKVELSESEFGLIYLKSP
jgi:hypothetical protein